LLDSKDAFVNLSLLAANTEKIELGPIAISPYELHPLIMTVSLMTLNEISKGRAVIVVGAGGALAGNISVDSNDRPVTSTRECVEIIKQISTRKKVTFNGKIFKIRSFKSNWAPNSGPVVYVGANKSNMLNMACESSDGVMMTDIPLEYVNRIVRQVKDELVANGRNISSFRINNFYAWHVKDNYEDALKEARRYTLVRGIGRPEIAKAIGLSNEEFDLIKRNTQSLFRFLREGIPPKEIPEEILNRIIEKITIVGQVSELHECIEKVYQFKRNGLNEIALRVYGDAVSSIKLIGEKVVPMLQ